MLGVVSVGFDISKVSPDPNAGANNGVKVGGGETTEVATCPESSVTISTVTERA